MDINKTTITIRKRTNWEALDLGLVFVRNSFKELYVVWFIFTVPVFLVITIFTHYVLTYGIFAVIILFWLKPVFDRIPLFIFSHTLFNEKISFSYIFKNIIPFLFKSLVLDLLFRFLLPWRMYVTPVRILEGIKWEQKRKRIRIIKKDGLGAAILLSFICLVFEIFIYISFFFLIYFFYSSDFNIIKLLFEKTSIWISFFIVFLYYVSASIIEPFFVASGFSLYINRRVYVEGWDIELEFRRMKMRLMEKSQSTVNTSKTIILILILLLTHCPGHKIAAQLTENPKELETIVNLDAIDNEIQDILEMPEFSEYKNKYVIKIKDEFERDNDDSFSEDKNMDPAMNTIAELIASLLPWVFGIVICMAVIYILVKNNIIKFRPGVSKRIPLKSEIEASYLDKTSLPPDIIKSAKVAWDKGNPVAALSLLYRGAIYYIAQLEKIFIPDHTTEKENLSILNRNLTERKQREVLMNNFTFLTMHWQQCAYAKRLPEHSTFYNLCETWKIYFDELGKV